jgi:hypothetical protein
MPVIRDPYFSTIIVSEEHGWHSVTLTTLSQNLQQLLCAVFGCNHVHLGVGSDPFRIAEHRLKDRLDVLLRIAMSGDAVLLFVDFDHPVRDRLAR